MANSIKHKYGERGIFGMTQEFTGSLHIESDSLLFNINSILLRNKGEFKLQNEFYLPKTFNWNDMNYKIRGWE